MVAVAEEDIRDATRIPIAAAVDSAVVVVAVDTAEHLV